MGKVNYTELNNMNNEELVRVYQNADGVRVPAEQEYAINLVIQRNMDIVNMVIRKYDTRRIDRDDLVDGGRCGLLFAAQQYDPEKGALYRTYAWHKVKAGITQRIKSETGNTEKVYYSAMARYVKNAIDGLRHESGAYDESYEPHPKDIADYINYNFKPSTPVAVSTVVCALRAINGSEATSYENMLEEGCPVQPADHSYIVDVQKDIEEIEFRENIAKVIKSLRPEEQIVCKMAFGFIRPEPFTDGQIAEVLNQNSKFVEKIPNKQYSPFIVRGMISAIREKLKVNPIIKRYGEGRNSDNILKQATYDWHPTYTSKEVRDLTQEAAARIPIDQLPDYDPSSALSDDVTGAAV